MKKISLCLLSIAIFLTTACSNSSALPETTFSDASRSCEELFGLWTSFGYGQTEDTSQFVSPPEEIANVRSWDVDRLDNVMLGIAELKVPVSFRKIWVVNDLNEEGDYFEPTEAVSLADSLNENESDSTNLNYQDMGICIFRSLQSTQTCKYTTVVGSLPIEEDSWQQVSHMFVIGLETKEVSYLGTAEGEEIGCPYETDYSEKIIGPEVKDEQIQAIWNELQDIRYNIVQKDASLGFLEIQRLYVFLPSFQGQYILLIGTEDAPEQVFPVLFDNSEGNSYVQLGFNSQKRFSNIVIQEAEILDTSAWKQNEMIRGTVYSLNNTTSMDNLTGQAFRPVGEAITLLQDGKQTEEFVLDITSVKGTLEFPTIFIDGTE